VNIDGAVGLEGVGVPECKHYPEDGCSKYLLNVGPSLVDYTESHPRRWKSWKIYLLPLLLGNQGYSLQRKKQSWFCAHTQDYVFFKMVDGYLRSFAAKIIECSVTVRCYIFATIVQMYQVQLPEYSSFPVEIFITLTAFSSQCSFSRFFRITRNYL
jgi:hypothetical protein